MTKRAPEGRDTEDAWISGLLDDLARTPDAAVPDALMLRVLEDAEAMRPAPCGVRVAVPWWRQIMDGLGGGIAVGGLVAAAATGFVFGLGGLEAIESMGLETYWLVNDETYYQDMDPLTAFGWDMEES